ncbi:MAG: ArsR/SmtB family transcription factor [Pseudomonadota bacterium]
MSTRSPKHALFETFAFVAKALAHAHRLELLEQVAQGERPVEALAKAAGLTIANASQHLLLLRRAGLIVSRRDGKKVLYHLSGDDVLELLSALRGVAKKNAAQARQIITDYFAARDSLEPISRAELIKRMRKKSVTILDVRPEDEYALGHIPTALNIPFLSLERRLKELPRDRDIIAYCRGPYCMLSFEAVSLLRRKGFRVQRLEYGFPEWQAADRKA